MDMDMDMDDHEVILHQFDTIWFFSNALSPPSNKNPQPEKPSQPPQAVGAPDACENRAPSGQASDEAGSLDQSGAEENPKERCSEQRRKRSSDKENRELLHLELRSAWERTQRREGRGRRLHDRRVAFGSCRRCNWMPCSGDDSAMKEHLRSWAHAVASAVK